MNMGATSILMMLGLVMGAEDAPRDTIGSEFKKLEGDWIPVCIKEGQKVRGPDFLAMLRIKEAKVTIEPGQGNRAEPGRLFAMKAEVGMRTGEAEEPLGVLSINPLKEPKTFDLSLKDVPGLGGGILLGIYQWDGEVLKLCLKRDQLFGDRPRQFDWVVILTRDAKKERWAIEDLAKILPLENANSKDRCRTIIKTHPKTAAAMVAQDYLDHGLLSEHELLELKGAAAMVDLAKKAPMEKARGAYIDILKKYPGTKAAEEASRLLIEIDEPNATKDLASAKQLVQAGKKEEAKRDLLKIIESYPETRCAKEAAGVLDELKAGMNLDLAQQLAINDFKDRACETCEEIIRQYPASSSAGQAKELVAGLKLEIAQKLANDGLKLKAGKMYKEIVKLYPQTAAGKKCQEYMGELSKDVEATWKFNLARLLAMDALKLGREDLKEKAIAKCQEIIENYPKTKSASEAEKLMKKLSIR